MDKQYIPKFFVVALAGIFCWLNIGVVAAQTATNLNCKWCVGPGEMGWNAVPWGALDPAVRAHLTTQQNDINALKESDASPGVQVSVNGITVGALISVIPPAVELDLPGGGTVLVGEAGGGGGGGTLLALSPMGYVFQLSNSNISNLLSQEGQIPRFPMFFDQINCNGGIHFPIEGHTGVFSNFELGSGFPRPAPPWAARQGFVFGSTWLTDPNQAYFVRKDATVTVVTLHSFRWINPNAPQLPTCVNFSDSGWDLDPLLSDHTVVPVEINDPTVTGVNGIGGGNISIGF